MIRNIRLQNYRSYKDESFEFSNRVNIVVGPNASGKTNLLEALQVVLTGEAYRGKDSLLIRDGANWAKLNAATTSSERSVLLTKVNETTTSKVVTINDQEIRRIKLEHTLPLVLFEPNDLMLISGSPERRRDYLDELLERTVSGYRQLRRQYARALQQRNALLKRGVDQPDKLFPWNIRLSELGGSIASYRSQLIDKFAAQLSVVYSDLASNKVIVGVHYQSIHNLHAYGSDLLHKLEQNTRVDIARGYTGCGPHRDDFALQINDRSAQNHASRGEARTLVLSLKIVELGLSEKARDKQPIMLLDDVFSELDGARRHALTNHLQNYQTFITTTDADAILGRFLDKALIIPTEK